MDDLKFKVIEQTQTADYAEFVIEPLPTGYGATLGQALRRVLLSAIPGAAATAVKIGGVKHKFSSIPGLKENVVELLLNIKQLSFRLGDARDMATVTLSVKGPKQVTAADLTLSDGVEIANKEQYIASLATSKDKLDVELTVERGYGYSLAEDRVINTIGVMATDAIFSPVKRVSHEVEPTRVGRQTNLDKLTLKIWTDGTISPREALDIAAKNLAKYFVQIYEPQATGAVMESLPMQSNVADDVLKLTIDELDLPTRIYNSLRNGGIETIGQLLETPKKELVSMRNMGGKSIAIIEEKLQEKGINLPA